MLWNDAIYYGPFICKSNCFHLVKAISFSIVFTFRIFGMILFKFSLDLNTYNYKYK